MKLLIIYHAGLVKDAKAIFREYARQGIDLTVIIPSKIYSSADCLEYNYKDDEKTYRFIPIEFRTGFKFFPLFRKIQQIKPDIIHVLDEYSSLYLTQTIVCRNILYRKKVPIFAYAFQNIPFKSPPFVFEFSLKFFKRIIYKILYPLIFYYHKKNINGVVGSGSEALKNIETLGVRVPMQRIFWGVDFSIFYPQDRNLCREKLRIPKNIKLVGYFGRIIKEKGVDKLVKAISKINDCHLMLVGSGNYKYELDKIIDSLGIRDKVYWYDNINHDKLGDYYNCFDVFILPSQTISSWKEQYGRVLVEAMGCHIPVIGSSSGAIPNVLNGYPKHLIFKEKSIDDLIDKIKQVEELKFPKDFEIDKFLYKFSTENFVTEHIKFFNHFLK